MLRWASLSSDWDNAEVLGGLGSGPDGGSFLRGSLLGGGLFAQSSAEHFAAISQGSRSIHRVLSLVSDSMLLLGRAEWEIRESEDVGVEGMTTQDDLS
jgi:hypothetical protein